MAVQVAPEGVINIYGTLDELKARCGVAGTAADVSLWFALHGASRGVDDYCGRSFFIIRATRMFDIDNPASFTVPDLASVTSLREDADHDRVYEVTRDTDDYILYPLNASPEAEWGRPYNRVVAHPQGLRPSFATGRSSVQLDGEWGYRSLWADTGADVSGGTLSSTVTTVAVSSGAAFSAGMTVRVGAEQMFVRQVSGSDLTVVRGLNGTTPSSHAGGTDVFVFRHPAQVVEATLLHAARAWKRKDSAYGPVTAGAHGLGAVRVVAGMDPDVERLLSPFRKLPVGAGV
jgi:hypothetical protein